MKTYAILRHRSCGKRVHVNFGKAADAARESREDTVQLDRACPHCDETITATIDLTPVQPVLIYLGDRTSLADD